MVAPHSRIDISVEISFSHMLEFSKVVVGFVIELGGSQPLTPDHINQHPRKCKRRYQEPAYPLQSP